MTNGEEEAMLEEIELVAALFDAVNASDDPYRISPRHIDYALGVFRDGRTEGLHRFSERAARRADRAVEIARPQRRRTDSQ
jgi:hypothetical protein